MKCHAAALRGKERRPMLFSTTRSKQPHPHAHQNSFASLPSGTDVRPPAAGIWFMERGRLETKTGLTYWLCCYFPVAVSASEPQPLLCNQIYVITLKGVVRDFGHRTSFPSEPVCYLTLETVFNTFHSVLVA